MNRAVSLEAMCVVNSEQHYRIKIQLGVFKMSNFSNQCLQEMELIPCIFRDIFFIRNILCMEIILLQNFIPYLSKESKMHKINISQSLNITCMRQTSHFKQLNTAYTKHNLYGAYMRFECKMGALKM